ncbi:stage II sporulation protein D [Ornithinibacillus sp. L9]|uniref:Stage II sporulation protein D n=1 Tax=Ornithinibacillus caprae TaxID=2678566 RepID=A0A6N8FJP0_9BACI|nr:stage II sporulation protein D [Ornithinibacillus caprae]MUK89675.1 stage II sporulation protein D [Ornithinibacillus caprae]
MRNRKYNSKLIQKKLKQKASLQQLSKTNKVTNRNLPSPKTLGAKMNKGHSKWKLPSIFIVGLIVIILVIPTLIVVPSISKDQYQASTMEQESEYEDLLETDSAVTVSVMRTQTNSIEDVPLETYVSRVVASEMPAEFEMEALKSQALAARTYIVNKLIYQEEDAESDVSDSIFDQVYKSEDELRDIWGKNYNSNMKKIAEAVAATEGKILTYNNSPIDPQFFSTSNGYTENSEDYYSNEIPYLRSVESPWDEASPYFLDQETFEIADVENKLEIDLPDNNQFAIETTRTESNRVKELKLGEYTFSGRDVRDALELRSSDFTIEQKNDYLIFKTKGNGHGVGMSQYGANGMAKEGKTYEEIVTYYYKDVEISTVSDSAPAIVAR